jgi:XTP/dITP diphosphohydrolase
VSRARLILASQNLHKLAELRRALPGWEIDLVGRDDSPPENGTTFEENARIKARWGRVHAPSEAWAVGEDSGIEAAALGSRPGIHSARWDHDPLGRLLAELEHESDRRCRYRCVMVAIGSDGAEIVTEGTLEGVVASEPRGTEGFGYDPLVVPSGETRTVAELGDAWKTVHSHRARAAAALAEHLVEGAHSGRLGTTSRPVPP